jgi:hypothetical protein
VEGRDSMSSRHEWVGGGTSFSVVGYGRRDAMLRALQH